MLSQMLLRQEEDYPKDEIPAIVQQVINGADKCGILECSRIFKVEPTYYDWELDLRKQRLNAPTINHLCKSLLFHNTRWQPIEGQEKDDYLNPTHPKFLLVVVQYTDKISSKKLNVHVRGRAGNVQNMKKCFNMRIAPEEDAIRYTGYGNNGVTPIGMLHNVPVVISDKIASLNPPLLYLGCGHVDWKIALPVHDLANAYHASIVDLSE
jgi:prolyl-tRNA editing enzyme YbaK/EbsC (Cys-tRNA(Pro) deacylase)